jgi:cytochrome P450
LSLQQLKSELVIATLAGFETTSNALSWTIGALAAHPRAMVALEQVFGKVKFEFNWWDLVTARRGLS